MAAHFIGLDRGKDGAEYSDFTFDTSATGDDMEVRIEDAPGWTRLEVVNALKAIIKILEEPAASTFPPL